MENKIIYKINGTRVSKQEAEIAVRLAKERGENAKLSDFEFTAEVQKEKNEIV